MWIRFGGEVGGRKARVGAGFLACLSEVGGTVWGGARGHQEFVLTALSLRCLLYI